MNSGIYNPFTLIGAHRKQAIKYPLIHTHQRTALIKPHVGHCSCPPLNEYRNFHLYRYLRVKTRTDGAVVSGPPHLWLERLILAFLMFKEGNNGSININSCWVSYSRILLMLRYNIEVALSEFIINFNPHSAINWASMRENLFSVFANNKSADQPAHPRSLISAFVIM